MIITLGSLAIFASYFNCCIRIIKINFGEIYFWKYNYIIYEWLHHNLCRWSLGRRSASRKYFFWSRLCFWSHCHILCWFKFNFWKWFIITAINILYWWTRFSWFHKIGCLNSLWWFANWLRNVWDYQCCLYKWRPTPEQPDRRLVSSDPGQWLPAQCPRRHGQAAVRRQQQNYLWSRSR